MKNAQYEVEYRARISSETFNTLLSRGRSKFKGTFRGPLIIEDAYFCPNHVKQFSEVEMNEVGSFSLRLRQESENDKTIASLNTKIIRKMGDHNAWAEHEIGISSIEESRKILKAIGFKPFFEFKKERYTYKDGMINTCLELISDFGPIIEVEILTNEEGAEKAKKTLLSYLIQNGISKEAIVEKSITNMLMRELASFQDQS